MKAKEFNAHPSYNVFTGGQRYSYDEYNREYKKVRYKSAEEYASRNVQEYHRYPETKDLTASDDKREQQATGTAGALHLSRAFKTKAAADKRRRVFQQVVCLIAGSTIIVSTYQAMNQRAAAEAASAPSAVVQEAEQDSNEPIEQIIPEEPVTEEPVTEAPPNEAPTSQSSASANTAVASSDWVWSDDNETASVKLYDSEGNLIKEVPADISITEKDATCNKEGSKTYTARADYDGKSYSDTRTETLKPLGHSFDDGKEVDGTMVFECTRCHEQFKIANSTAEND